VEKKKSKKRMEDYGYKGILVYVKEEEYEALREYCFKNRIKHSPFVRSLIIEKLKKEGMIKKTTK
jgi:hypothetical protein